MAQPAAMKRSRSIRPVRFSLCEKRVRPGSITHDDGARIGSACVHEDIHEQSTDATGVCDLRKLSATVARSCGARVARNCTKRAKPQLRIAPRVRNVSSTLDGTAPQYDRGAQRIPHPSRNPHALVPTPALPVLRRGEQNNSESILVSPRLITMPPSCGTSRVLPYAPPSCSAKFSSLVINRCFWQPGEIS